jgi:hypothetical protein
MLALAQTDSTTDRLAHQVELEKLFNKNQTVPRIRQEFQNCKDVDFASYMLEKEIPLPFGFDLLTQMALHKRTTLPILVGILRSHFDNSQLTADMILRAAEADLVDWNPNLRVFIVKFTLSDDVQAELDMFQYPLPMVVEPQPITCNTETGYLMTGGSVILRKNHHDDDVCLDHLNRVNQIKFSIDHDTAHMVRNQWRNLDKPKAGETKADFEKRKRAFEKYDFTAKDVIALLVQEGNEFYLTHKYDKRGRVYCQGYHVNYQGAAWNKAVIQLADKEYID